MFCCPLKESTRFALVTAPTRVASAGLWRAGGITGSAAMSAKLPAPELGTAEHPVPIGWSVGAAATVPGGGGAELVVDAIVPVEPQALIARAKVTAAVIGAAR